jgi:peptidoglycan/LPS O-acetylase OafA/YrhL
MATSEMAKPIVNTQYLRAVLSLLIVALHTGLNFQRSIPTGEVRTAPSFILSGFPFWCVAAGQEGSEGPFMLGPSARPVPLYLIFLWHIPLIVRMTLLLSRLGVRDGLACVAATIPACIVVGIVLYRALERPMTQWLFGLIDRRPVSQEPIRQAPV